MARRIYFDNAATSFPKPESVYQAVDHYGRAVGASAGRGAYQEALASGEIIAECRQRIAQLINAERPESIVMTFNCTDGLVLGIKGVLTQPDMHVVTTRMEHNSVLRPLGALAEQMGLQVTYVPADGAGLVDPADIRRALRPNTALVACLHASNVCGSMQDIDAIAAIAREADVPLLVDAAQTVGHVPIDVQAWGAALVAFPGHKALLGPLGTGALYVKPGFEARLRPLKEGGTGSRSEVPLQPDEMPDRYESGSHNALGIAGLNSGVAYLLEQGQAKLRTHEEALCAAFLAGTRDVPGLSVYGPRDVRRRVGVFSVTMDGFEPAELAAVLESQFGLLTRPGLHCAPFAHETLGTLALGGTARFSMGPFTTREDVDYAADALRQIAGAAVRA